MFITLFLPCIAHTIFSKTASKGLELEVETLSTPLPCVVHSLTIDPQKRSISLEHAYGGGCVRESVSCIVARTQALAGINANNYRRGGAFNGNAVDFLKIGSLYADPGIKRAALAWSKGDIRPLIGHLEIEHTLTFGKQTFPVDAVNQPSNAHQAILYTDRFGTSTKNLHYGWECIIRRGHIEDIVVNPANTPIPPNGYLYSVGKDRPSIDMSLLKKGMRATHKSKIFLKNQQGKTDITHKTYIVSGAGILIQDGSIVKNFEDDFMHDRTITHCPDEIAADFSCPKERGWLITQLHPRTAVGILPDGKWLFVVVDGRQPGYSVGMTLAELANYMLKKGCIHALNMGGGGCSTLVLERDIINSPCGTKEHTKSRCQKEKRARERPVCSAFIVKP